MAEPDFGMKINRLDDEPRPAVGANMSTVGMVVTAPGADATAFPVGTAVRFNSGDEETVGKLGDTGSVKGQIDLVNQQLGGKSADIVLVRVVPGADDAATMTALLDGFAVLVASPAETGVTPRLIMIPSYTFQQETPATKNAVLAGVSAGLGKLTAHMVASGPHSTRQAYVDWEETIGDQRVIPVETWVKVGNPAEDIDSVGLVIGQIIARDDANGGVPSKVAANRQVSGIVAANRAIPYDMMDGDTEGQIILAANGAIIIKGERGVSGSLSAGGFTLISYATASTDVLWRFYNQSRMRDYIELMMQETCSYFLGRFNLTHRTVDLILQTMNGVLRDLKATDDLLDYRVYFEADKNSPENLRLGKLRTAFRAEEPPVLTNLEIDSCRYREAYSTLLGSFSDLAA